MSLYGFTHRTKEGKNIFLEEMETDHLVNSILFFTRGLKKAKEILEDKGNKWEALIFQNMVDQEDAQAYVERFFSHVPMYIFEALLRGVAPEEFCFGDIIKTIGRTSNIINRSEFMLSSGGEGF